MCSQIEVKKGVLIWVREKMGGHPRGIFVAVWRSQPNKWDLLNDQYRIYSMVSRFENKNLLHVLLYHSHVTEYPFSFVLKKKINVDRVLLLHPMSKRCWMLLSSTWTESWRTSKRSMSSTDFLVGIDAIYINSWKSESNTQVQHFNTFLC